MAGGGKCAAVILRRTIRTASVNDKASGAAEPAIGGPVQIFSSGSSCVGAKSPAAARGSRLPAGHPEGFLEAFANHYNNFADTILLKEEGKAVDPIISDFPQVHEGVRGMAFI